MKDMINDSYQWKCRPRLQEMEEMGVDGDTIAEIERKFVSIDSVE